MSWVFFSHTRDTKLSKTIDPLTWLVSLGLILLCVNVTGKFFVNVIGTGTRTGKGEEDFYFVAIFHLCLSGH